MKLIIITICTLAIVSLSAQSNNQSKLRLEIEILRNTLATADVIYGRTTGVAGGETTTHKIFTQLVNLASIQELRDTEKITLHSVGIIDEQNGSL